MGETLPIKSVTRSIPKEVIGCKINTGPGSLRSVAGFDLNNNYQNMIIEKTEIAKLNGRILIPLLIVVRVPLMFYRLATPSSSYST